jgi:hypothetical protein
VPVRGVGRGRPRIIIAAAAAIRSARITAVSGIVTGTAVAGALLSCLRERSGSLAAPVLVALTANCAAPPASVPARRAAYRRLAGVRSPSRLAPSRLAPSRLAPSRLAPSRLAP